MNKINQQTSNVNSDNTKENKKYNLKNDIIFKTFFSRKGNEIFLIDFLEALLKIKIEEIQIKEEVSLEQLAIKEKGGRLDLQARLNDGIIVNIELQIKNHQNIEERTTYYSSKVIVFLDDYNKEAVQMAEEKNETLKKARIEMNYLTGDAAVKRMAELEEKWEMDRISEIGFAKREGKEEGKEEGKKEKQIEIAKNMLKKGIDIGTIIELTGLTKEEIDAI